MVATINNNQQHQNHRLRTDSSQSHCGAYDDNTQRQIPMYSHNTGKLQSMQEF